MNWSSSERAYTSGPYRIYGEVRGFSIWLNKDGNFGVLTREPNTLAGAKAYCEAHKAKEDFQKTQLEAVFVK